MHKGYRYHILERTIPSDPDGSELMWLLDTWDYPAKVRRNHTGRWIIFDGQKTTELEATFSAYEVTDPPAFMIKTKNMLDHDAKTICETEGVAEDTGWVVSE